MEAVVTSLVRSWHGNRLKSKFITQNYGNILNTNMIITPEKDPMGMAIWEYYKTGICDRLWQLSSTGDEEIELPYLFRSYDQMPEVDRMALDMAEGRILDVGAGAGCHSLELQNRGKMVTAIDISPLSCATMRERGIKDVRNIDFFDRELEGSFDTILMLMNGSGLVGKLKELPSLFYRLAELLSDSGCCITDIYDIRHLYEDQDAVNNSNRPYYGEIDLCLKYRDTVGSPFYWLYTDFETFHRIADECGMNCTLLMEGPMHNYLVKLTTK